MRSLAPGAEPRFKWPNDVLVADRKIAGVLLESDPAGLAIGIGLNLARAPAADTLEPGATPPTAVAAHARLLPTPDRALSALATAFDRWLAVWAVDGFPGEIRRAWLRDAARLGRPLIARLPGGELRGRFSDVDEAGALVLDTAEGPRRISAADVYYPDAADPGPSEP